MEKTGEQLAIDGANQASDHADRVRGDWSDIAYGMFCRTAELYGEFMTEDVARLADAAGFTPPDARAWGAVARKAKSAGIVVPVRVQKATKTSSHSGYATVWIHAKKMLRPS